MNFLTLDNVLELHRMLIERSGGSHGLRDLGALESALAQPMMTFDQRSKNKRIVDQMADTKHG